MELFPEGELLDIESVELVICDNNESCLADLVVGQEANELSVVVQRDVVDAIERNEGSQAFQPMVETTTSSGSNSIMQLPVVVPSSLGSIKTVSLGGMASSNMDIPCTANAVPGKTSQVCLEKDQYPLDDSVIAEELDTVNYHIDSEIGAKGMPTKIDITDSDVTQLRRSKRNAMRNSLARENNKVFSFSSKGNHCCDDCDFSYGKECSNHKIQTISDKPVPSRAWATLPAAYLMITKVSSENGEKENGVFARKTIPKRTQFGPVEGIFNSKDSENIFHKLDLLVENEHGEVLRLDVSDENSSNWMRFVRPAKFFKDINLILSQQGHSLYFTTTRLIHPREELLVWYSLPYAQRRGLPMLLPNQDEKKMVEDAENSWPCFECNDRFLSSEELQRHLNEHEQCDDGKSTKTRTKQSNMTLRRKNMKRVASPEYRCQTCNRIFPRNYSLKRHLVLHTGEKRYSCNICGLQFSHPYNKDRHFKKHHKKVEEGGLNGKTFSDMMKNGATGITSREWLCIHCNLSFDSPSVLSLHTLAHAAENLEEDENKIDVKREETISEMGQATSYSDLNACSRKSMECDGDGNSVSFLCPQCTQEFSTKKELILHASGHGTFRRCRGSLNPAKPHKCDLCYKAFASEDRLQKHMLVHGTEESKPLQCEVCLKRFLNNSALACHIKVHTEEKTFECPICREVFYQVLALKEHVHVHCHQGVFTCPHCAKVFDEYSLIRKHIRAFHSERKHKCSFCGKLFPTMDKLKTHMLRHSDHREFLCANCGKQFKRKDKLKEHMKRMHSPEREAKLSSKPARPPNKKKFIPKVSPTDYQRFIYKCHSCLVGFKRRGMLVNHLAKRHPDVSPDTVPELNLPILKTTRDYYCQYCEKVYKSSSKRKAHILKNHPGAELPMSNRKKGGMSETLGFPNPTYSQTVGSITTHAHNCTWCHKQYASKPKLLQHQRKKHLDLLPQSQQVPRTTRIDSADSPVSSIEGKFLSGSDETHHVIHMQDGEASDVNVSVEYETSSAEKLRDYQDTGIIIDASSLKQTLKAESDDNGIGSTDLLVQAMSELTENPTEYRLFSSSEHYFKIIHTAPTHIMVASTESLPLSPCPSPVVVASSIPSPETGSGGGMAVQNSPSNATTLLTTPPNALMVHDPTHDAATADSSCSSSSSLSSSSTMTSSNSSNVSTFLTPVSVSVSSSLSIETSSQLQHILTCSPTYATTALPPTSPSPNVLPRTWAATYTSYTAR